MQFDGNISVCNEIMRIFSFRAHLQVTTSGFVKSALRQISSNSEVSITSARTALLKPIPDQ